ncbi:hypothetical protein PFTANZ_03629 [Plasmodium falciparum Tanzania (2000708)]|uniref:Uncharacterized protein n=1 Tax=Plasmodium falciparum Tanzania (2000708) TaxID=1036725 RepID=A0A024W667_PLAFA|nr:hypothetical protein PFTANZ_03629 [Plasmodium falciparum Tanzania (2000708)]
MASRKGVTIENKLSARDVLEKIGLEIYNKEIEKTIPHKDQLIGTLSKAQFLDGLYRSIGWGVRYGYNDSCSLDHKFHTNINNGTDYGRNPCHGRKENRFDENAEAYCNSDKIRGNENNRNDGTACVPFRRQNLCDKNLEYLINKNTENTHDLLGNVLVTAKYEGASIVAKHPQKGTSEVCTALSRSFADIGDIVRGKDMFKRNEEDAVQKGLKVVFRKIYEGLKNNGANVHYKEDKDENYYKLRNDWWTVNRDQVWKAMTCVAPENAYFRKTEADGIGISSLILPYSKCGRDTDPPVVDYIPQRLRWMSEWSEYFCNV